MISYKRLKKLLIDLDIMSKNLIDEKILTPTNSVYVNNDSGYLNLRTIDRLLNYLKQYKSDIKIEDIIEFIPDPPATQKD